MELCTVFLRRGLWPLHFLNSLGPGAECFCWGLDLDVGFRSSLLGSKSAQKLRGDRAHYKKFVFFVFFVLACDFCIFCIFVLSLIQKIQTFCISDGNTKNTNFLYLVV